MTTPAEFVDVKLEEAIVRGDTSHDTLRLRRPRAGELRGLSLQDLLRADVTATIGILPRISDPTLTAQEAENLSLPDLAELAGTVAGFFMTSAQQETVRKMTSMA